MRWLRVSIWLVISFSSAKAADICWRTFEGGGLANIAAQVRASIVVGEFSGAGSNDVMVAYSNVSPAIVLYPSATNSGPVVVESGQLPISAGGGAAFDVDQDGDLDVVFGSDGAEAWWWENPSPDISGAKPWIRHAVTTDTGSIHRGQIFADLIGSGRRQIVLWDQGSGSIYYGEVPREARTINNWNLAKIFTVTNEVAARMDTLAVADIDMDGTLDLLAGNYWIKWRGETNFSATRIGNIAGASAIGRFREGTFPQIVIAPQSGKGRLMWYDCKVNPDVANSWAGRQLLDREIGPVTTLAIGDIDKNGWDDILVAELNAGLPNAWIIYSDGKGNFRTTDFPLSRPLYDAKLSDVDRNGRLDIATVRADGFQILFNEVCK